MTEQTQNQPPVGQPEPELTIILKLSEVNNVIAGLEQLGRPLIEKIVAQAQAQLQKK